MFLDVDYDKPAFFVATVGDIFNDLGHGCVIDALEAWLDGVIKEAHLLSSGIIVPPENVKYHPSRESKYTLSTSFDFRMSPAIVRIFT